MSDKLTDFAISKMQSFLDSMNTAMPKITHAVLQVVQMNCTINMIVGFVCLTFWLAS